MRILMSMKSNNVGHRVLNLARLPVSFCIDFELIVLFRLERLKLEA